MLLLLKGLIQCFRRAWQSWYGWAGLLNILLQHCATSHYGVNLWQSVSPVPLAPSLSSVSESMVGVENGSCGSSESAALHVWAAPSDWAGPGSQQGLQPPNAQKRWPTHAGSCGGKCDTDAKSDKTWQNNQESEYLCDLALKSSSPHLNTRLDIPSQCPITSTCVRSYQSVPGCRN